MTLEQFLLSGRSVRVGAVATGLALALGGCATLGDDGGFAPVGQAARDRLGKEVVWARSEADLEAIARQVGVLVSKPLSVDDAVQVALLNNRGLQAALQELGITEAEVVQAGRLPNPGFSFARLSRGETIERERGIHINLARVLAMPLVNELEARRFDQIRSRTTLAVLALAAQTRKAYFDALAAEETVRYTQKVMEAAEASAELARRMAQAGNFSKLRQAREQGFYADAAVGLARSRQVRQSTRERLTRLLGLWGAEAQFALPARLPDLPAAADDLPDIERTALTQRLDVRAATAAVEQTAKNLGLTKMTRFINVLEIGAVRNSSNHEPTQRGWEVSFELPVFDWGDARAAKAQAVYMQALHRAAEAAIEARSEVREAYGNYRVAYDIARHYRDEIVPLRSRIAEENLLRYNGMLIGVFELLADARAQIASVNASIEALRDFWIARSELDMALVGKPAAGMAPGPARSTEPDAAPH